MRLAKVTDTLRGLARYVVLAASTALVACGGPGGTAPTTTPSPTIAVALSAATVTAATPVTVTARLLGGDNKPIVGAKVTFSTDAAVGVISPGELVTSGTGTTGSGQLISGSAVTSAEGLASVQLRAGPSAGVGTVTVTYDVPATSGSGTSAGSAQTLTAQVNYNSTGGGVRPSSVVVTAPNTTVDASTPAVLSAQVFGADGKPVPNVVVSFSVDASLGSLSPGKLSTDGTTSTGTAISNAAGIASIQLNAGPEAGAGNVTASYTPPSAGGTTSTPLVGSFGFTSRGGGVKPSTRLVLSISSGTISSAAPATITARLIRTDGVSVASQRITFATNSDFGLINPGAVNTEKRSEGSALTDINGFATIQLSAGPKVGAETVTVTFVPTLASSSASASSIQDSINYSSQGGGTAPETNIQLSLSSPSLSANSPVVVTARFTRTDGRSISGQRIEFVTDANLGVFSPGSIDASGQSSGSGITDGNGVATIQIFAGPRTGVGTITARFIPLTPADSASASGVSNGINYTSAGGGSRASTLTLSITEAVLTSNTDSMITARLIGADNRPVVRGVITFTTLPATGIFDPASGVATTDADGVATIKIRAGTQAGPGTVTATFTPDSGAAITATLAYGSNGGGSVATARIDMRFVNGSTSINAATPSTIEATLLGANGQRVPNTRITFTTDGTIGVLIPGTGTALTNSEGVATIQLRAGALQGAGTVNAVSDALSNGAVARGSLGYNSSGGGGPVDSGVAAASLQLIVSSGTLISDGVSSVTLTALVKDANNNTLAGKRVTFSSDRGSIVVDPASNGLTAANGQVTATLSTLGDKSNQTITVRAAVSGLPEVSNTIVVSGTKITVSGVAAMVVGATTPLTIRIQDGAGKPVGGQVVQLASSLGNQFLDVLTGNPITTALTDATGQLTVNYRAIRAGTNNTPDTISASALNATGVATILVSSDQFTMRISPTPGAALQDCSQSLVVEVPLSTLATVQATFLRGGVAQAGTVAFTTTRGTFNGAQQVALTSGVASIGIQSDTGGIGVVTASSGSSSAQCTIEYVATDAQRLVLQADSAVVPPRGKTTITATVRDARDNLVKNKTVIFTLTDSTGGSLSVGQGVTDSFGQTTTTYTAGNASSAKDGVSIRATVVGDPLEITPSPSLTLTVGGQSLFVRVGTGNTVLIRNETTYSLPYAVIVTDAAGNAVKDAQLSLTAQSIRYYRGQYLYNGVFWVRTGGAQTVSGTGTNGACSPSQITTFQANVDSMGNPIPATCLQINSPRLCQSEDLNVNGLLDTGEDINRSGQLEPGFVASIPSSAITDAAGTFQFNIVYPKDRGGWVGIRLIARATVQGTEGVGVAEFDLPVAGDDLSNERIAPPGCTSPFGFASTSTACTDVISTASACNDRTVP